LCWPSLAGHGFQDSFCCGPFLQLCAGAECGHFIAGAGSAFSIPAGVLVTVRVPDTVTVNWHDDDPPTPAHPVVAIKYSTPGYGQA